eukprot:884870-Prymnesium_polylepis.2
MHFGRRPNLEERPPELLGPRLVLCLDPVAKRQGAAQEGDSRRLPPLQLAQEAHKRRLLRDVFREHNRIVQSAAGQPEAARPRRIPHCDPGGR